MTRALHCRSVYGGTANSWLVPEPRSDDSARLYIVCAHRHELPHLGSRSFMVRFRYQLISESNHCDCLWSGRPELSWVNGRFWPLER